MRGADFLVYVSEEDAKKDIALNYPNAAEATPQHGEDVLLIASFDDQHQLYFELYRYTHGDGPELWILNTVRLVDNQVIQPDES